MNSPIKRVAIRLEQDVVYVRTQSRLIAELLGFNRYDQTRICTAVSEIARNALEYAGGGEACFSIEAAAHAPQFTILIRDSGPGITDLNAILEGRFLSKTGLGIGITGSKRLLDHFHIETRPGLGTTVTLGKQLPNTAPPVSAKVLENIVDALAAKRDESPLAEIRRQNQELLATLSLLSQQDEALTRTNKELTTTNIGMVALYVDLDNRKKDLQMTIEELEAFSYSVSHDLRTPLRAIDGYAHMLEEKYSVQIDKDGQRMLGVIRSETARMAQLIDDLLTFSRLGRQKLDSQTIEMGPLVQTVFDELSALAPTRKIQLKLLPLPPAQGSLAMLRQVWVNLIGNAIKFTQRQETGLIEISAAATKDNTPIYTIKDNGVGFDMRHAGKLFGVFQRLHSEEEFEGTGVGLALVHRIITRHGGRIWAEAGVNLGANFHFTLPITKQ